MKNRLLVIDGNNRAWAAFHAYKKLSFKGKSVSVIYGLPSMIRSLIVKFKPNKVVITWESKLAKERLQILPTYKKRDPIPTLDYEGFRLQREIAKDLIFYLGIPQLHLNGYEGDDALTKVIMTAKKKYREIIIVSADKDFNQLIDKKVSIYNQTPKGKKVCIDYKNAFDELGYHPYQTVDYLTLVGDKSDNITGYRGIGPKKASTLLKKYDTLVNFLDSSESHNIIDNNILLELTLASRILMNLIYFYKEFIKGKISNSYHLSEPNPVVDQNRFKKLVKKYNMIKLMSDNFIKPFEL